jgi:ABC-2 type transport system permease protein
VNNTSAMSASRLWAAYLGEVRFEFLKSLRTPAFAVPTLFFPIMFYVLFGILLGSLRGNSNMAIYTFATYGVFGAMGPGLFGFGVSLAIEREQGLLTLKQALPSPPGTYLLARAAMAMLFVAIISLLLIVLAVTLGKVALTFSQGALLFVIDVLGALPFCAIGMYVGSLVSGQASPAIVNLIFLPMAFLSGLWLPLQFMPTMLQEMAALWPSYHLAQLALDVVGAQTNGTTGAHIAALGGVTVLCFWLAMRRMYRGGLRLFGAARGGPAFPLRRAATASIVWVSIALIIAGIMGGKVTSKPAADTAATSTATSTDTADAKAPESPAGVAAPADGSIAGFDAGSANAAYGTGWSASSDEVVGGASTAAIRVVDGGAEDTHGALEITGTIRPGFQWPFAGAIFMPNGPPMQGMMDYSKFKTLRLFVRGDGKKYVVTFFSTANQSSIPSSFPFETGPEWREVRVPLADFVEDLKRVRGIMLGANGPEGEFRLQVDNVRLE